MATIQYKTYQFNYPSTLIESDYLILKEVLTNDPKFNINPKSNFIETFKSELIFLLIGLLGGILASLEIAEWLNWVGGIPALFAFGSLFSFVPSLFSYLGYLEDKYNYYKKLKKDIIKASDYEDFIIYRKLKK